MYRIKKSMEHKLEKYNLSYSKYNNWPSCDSTDWMFRYWGENYNRLLAIKVQLDITHYHHDLPFIPRHTGTLRMSSTTARVWAARTIWAVLLLYTGTKQEEARRRLKRRRYYSCFILNFNAATAFFRIIIKIN